MAKKNIIISNNDGRVTSKSTFAYDNETDELTIDNASIGDLKINGLAGSKLIYANDGRLEAYNIIGPSGSTLQYDGNTFSVVEETPSFATGSAGGDLSGSYPFPKVVNISNVTNGTLPVKAGGTGKNLSETLSGKGGLLVGSNNSVRVLEADPVHANSFIVSKGGKWGLGAVPSLYPNVQYFTSSGLWSNSHGANFARVLIQGGGGSGGGGAAETTANSPGGGGGSGGWADITFPVDNITGAVVTVGAGGAAQTNPGTAGIAGGMSSFAASGMMQYVYANGGAGGGASGAAGGAGGGAGATSTRVLVKSGVAGAAVATAAVAGSDVSTGGGAGGNYAAAASVGPGTLGGFLGNKKNFGYGSDVNGNVIGNLVARGGTGANPTLLEDNQSVLDPYALLHMEPFYEVLPPVVSTSSFATYDVTLGGTAGAARFQNTVSRWGDYAPTFRSGSTYGAVSITPGYAVGTGDFTIEFWLYLNSTGSAGTSVWRLQLSDNRAAGAFSTSTYELLTTTTGSRLGIQSSNGSITGSTTVSASAWHHVAYVRQAGVLSIYLNGSREVTSSLFSGNSFGSGYITLGNYSAGTTALTYNVDGYIDNYRLSNSARYSGETYTVPTEKFTNDGNTIVLVAPTTTAFSPAETSIPTAQSYNPAITYNGSAYFTNEKPNFPGDYSLKPWFYSVNNSYNTGSINITPGYNLGTADFTAECWVWLNSTGSNVGSSGGAQGTRMMLFDTRNNGSTVTKFLTGIVAGGKLGFYTGTGASYLLTSSLSVPTGSWQHVALTRQNNVFRFYINGQQDVNVLTNTNSFTDTTSILIGNSSLVGEPNLSLDGYINNFRIIKGAQYTSSYTPPTAPFVRDNNTVVLINGAPYEQAYTTRTADSSYHGRTVTFNGSANLVQTASAFGDTGYVLSPFTTTATGSISVTGQSLGTNPFTIEGWIYRSSDTGSSNIYQIYDCGPTGISTARHSIYVDNATNKLSLYVGNGTTAVTVFTTNSTVPLNTWTHVALVRENTGSFGTKIYINGSRDIVSGTFANNLNSTSDFIIGNNAFGVNINGFRGYIDEFRITPKALYTTATYPVPTKRFSDPYNPLLLLHMEPTNGNMKSTVDSSKWGRSVSFTGSAAAGAATLSSSIGPFGTTTNVLVPSSGSAMTGSIVVQNNVALGNGPFTWEAWVYQTAKPFNVCTLYDTRASGTSTTGFVIYIDSSGRLNYFGNNGLQYTSNITIQLNTWTHVAFVRNGTNTNGACFYINGIRDTKSATVTTSNNTDRRAVIGANNDITTNQFFGRIDEVRLSKSVLYTGSYAPVPTAPFPNPPTYTVSKVASGLAGSFGSGGGGGGSTFGVLQDLNGGFVSGKGGDGYVVVISW